MTKNEMDVAQIRSLLEDERYDNQCVCVMIQRLSMGLDHDQDIAEIPGSRS